MNKEVGLGSLPHSLSHSSHVPDKPYDSSFMWHQPCQRCKYTTSVDIQKRAIKSYTVTHVKSHASAVSLLESGE